MASLRAANWLRAAVDVLLPRLCPVCGKTLSADERFLCRHCLSQLPRTRYERQTFNAFEQRFAGIVPIERAVSFFFYERTSSYAAILHDIKYHNMPQLGVWMGQQAAAEMRDSGCFDAIDAIVPVPLHFTKLASRGYNQSEKIASGVAKELGVPVVNALKAVRESETQTHKSAAERMESTRGRFALRNKYADELKNKHLLLLDDVVTTGSTLINCARPLLAIEGTTLSVFTLAAAHLD